MGAGGEPARAERDKQEKRYQPRGPLCWALVPWDPRPLTRSAGDPRPRRPWEIGDGAVRPACPRLGLELQAQQSQPQDASCLPALKVSDIEPRIPATDLEVATAGQWRQRVLRPGWRSVAPQRPWRKGRTSGALSPCLALLSTFHGRQVATRDLCVPLGAGGGGASCRRGCCRGYRGHSVPGSSRVIPVTGFCWTRGRALWP